MTNAVPPLLILVTLRDVYGETKAYPANEQARLLAEIAGTKTLTHRTLALAERMGATIQNERGDMIIPTRN